MRQHHPEDVDWRAPGCEPTSSPRIAGLLGNLDHALAELNALSLPALSPADLTKLLETLTGAAGRLSAATGRVALEADRRRLADDVGARNTPSWWAHRTRLTRAEAGRALDLAKRLDTDLHQPVARALAAGQLHADQAAVIAWAVDALPSRVSGDTRAKARDRLLAHAQEHDARALRILGKRILDVIAPEIAEAEEQKRLEEEEARANAKARITFFDDGHGQCHGRFTLPSHVGALLKEQLHGIANPRRHPLGADDTDKSDRPAEGMPEPVMTPERLGEAFSDYVENYPVDRLPRRGGGAFGVTVMLDLDALREGVGVGTLSTGSRISVGEVRRIACQAGIVPVVLDGASQPLDLGRAKRLASPAQRHALELRDGGCTCEDCGMPASASDAHHDDAWSEGGRTDLDNMRLLCRRHHRLAHDRRYEMRHLPGGKVSFHRRT